jgi:hypothetical protein
LLTSRIDQRIAAAFAAEHETLIEIVAQVIAALPELLLQRVGSERRVECPPIARSRPEHTAAHPGRRRVDVVEELSVKHG